MRDEEALLMLQKTYSEDLERKVEQLALLRQEKNQIQAKYDQLLMKRNKSP